MTGIFYEVEHLLKMVCSAVIRVGDNLCVGMVLQEFRQIMNLVPLFGSMGMAGGVRIVLLVHDENEVETLNISVSLEMAGSVKEVISSLCRMGTHAMVGKFAHVPVANACGVDMDFVGKSGFVYHVLHDAVGGRGAANVSETDEKERYGVFLCGGIHKRYGCKGGGL